MHGELKLWRNHLKSCALRGKGRGFTKCQCPVWCDGRTKGKRVRHSMGTANLDRAQRKLDRLVDPEAPPSIAVANAVEEYLEDCQIRGLKPSTIRSYRKTLAI